MLLLESVVDLSPWYSPFAHIIQFYCSLLFTGLLYQYVVVDKY